MVTKAELIARHSEYIDQRDEEDRFMKDVAGMLGIDEGPNHVVIAGQHVFRPSCVSPSRWLEFWETLRTKGEH